MKQHVYQISHIWSIYPTQELDQQGVWILPQVLRINLQVVQKKSDLSFVLGLQKQSFIISEKQQQKHHQKIHPRQSS